MASILSTIRRTMEAAHCLINGGTVAYQGENIAAIPTHKRVDMGIAYVQEGNRVFRDLTVEQNLLLDEPSGGLAPVIVKEVMERVAALKETGIGILLVEQAVEASVAIADHVSVLDMGRTVMSVPASEIADPETLRDAYFGISTPRS